MNDETSSSIPGFGEEQEVFSPASEVELVFDSTDELPALRADEVTLDGVDGDVGSEENESNGEQVTTSTSPNVDYSQQLEHVEKLLVYNDLLLIVICVSLFLVVGIRLGADLTRWFTAR